MSTHASSCCQRTRPGRKKRVKRSNLQFSYLFLNYFLFFVHYFFIQKLGFRGFSLFPPFLFPHDPFRAVCRSTMGVYFFSLFYFVTHFIFSFLSCSFVLCLFCYLFSIIHSNHFDFFILSCFLLFLGTVERWDAYRMLPAIVCKKKALKHTTKERK